AHRVSSILVEAGRRRRALRSFKTVTLKRVVSRSHGPAGSRDDNAYRPAALRSGSLASRNLLSGRISASPGDQLAGRDGGGRRPLGAWRREFDSEPLEFRVV